MLSPTTLKPARGSKRSLKRVGRGNASGHGTSSTRGGKGQTARSGGSRGLARLGFRRLMQSTPKLRGFNSLTVKPAVVASGKLNGFEVGATVTVATLKEKNLIPSSAQSAKIVVGGELTKKVSVDGVKVSEGAKAAIEKAGGSVK